MINPNDNVVVIVGHPDGGKTHLSKELEAQFPDHKMYHTDDYKDYGMRDGLYKLMSDIERDSPKKLIVEGVLGFRLLRKWEERKYNAGPFNKEHYLNPDLVIYANRAPREHRKDASDYTMRSLTPIWNEWLYMEGRHKPRIEYTR